MTFLGHIALFFFSGFTQYLLAADRGNQFGLFLMIGLPVTGVYFLGWWALLTCIVGAFVGARAFFESLKTSRNQTEE